MEFTNDFFIQAQGCIERVFRAKRPKLLELHGNIEAEIKSDNTPVTALDKEFEQDLKKTLREFDSSIGFEGEEFGIEGSRETFWLVDPIDGTESFIRGLPFVRNMATLIDNGDPVFTVVYRPIDDELFVAAQGEGAFRNGVPVQVSKRPINRSWIELFAPMGDATVTPMLSAVRSKIHNFRTLAEFTYIANGILDGRISYKSGGGPWDYAPQALLIAEAGGKVAHISDPNKKFDYREAAGDVLFANPVIFDELIETITNSIDKN